MGGHPGGAWVEIIRAHALSQGSRIYSEECDYPEAGMFLIAKTDTPDEETDAHVVEERLSVKGQRLALPLVMETVDELRTVLPRHRLIPLLVEALDEVVTDFGYHSLELDAEAPKHYEPGGPEWKAWVAGYYLAGVMSE